MYDLKRKKLLLMLFIASALPAQYAIQKYTINNGGGKMTGGIYEVNASIGQIDASMIQTGGSYSLQGGFWATQEIVPQPELIFKNGFE